MTGDTAFILLAWVLMIVIGIFTIPTAVRKLREKIDRMKK